jgi:hypothetical protein
LPRQLKYRVLPEKLAVSQLNPSSGIPVWAENGTFFSIVQTPDELSIVCEEDRVPPETRCEKGWLALKLQGPFPFEFTGVLSSFIAPLANAGIPIFALATFDTDYVLIKRDDLTSARQALAAAGHSEI